MRHDLLACIVQLEATGDVAPFPLAHHDRVGELRLPQKLYGGEAERSALKAAYQRVSRGAVELMLVSGAAGVGKSALVHELAKSVAQQRGLFVAGKFDPLCRGVPYAPLVQALRELVRQVLAERADALLQWKARLLRAVGSNGQVLIDLIPELSLLLGPQPSVPDLGPAEAQNRFYLTLHSFVRAFAAATHPLVICLDGMELADPSSVKLMQLLLTDPDGGYTLVISVYREAELGPDHPLTEAVTELKKGGVTVNETHVKPLAQPHVARFVADALGTEPELVSPLSTVVWAKTHGNPFFLRQFLRTLRESGLLSFDTTAQRWTWDINGAQDLASTENVAALMADQLRRLAPVTRRALMLAACIGPQFDLRTLSQIYQQDLPRTAADLWEAIQHELLVPLDPEYRC